MVSSVFSYFVLCLLGFFFFFKFQKADFAELAIILTEYAGNTVICFLRIQAVLAYF